MSELLHSWGRNPGPASPGPRFELAPGTYTLRVTDRPGERLAVKLQRLVSKGENTEETVMTSGLGGRRVPMARLLPGQEHFEDVTGLSLTVTEPGVYRVVYGPGGGLIELVKES